jgi:hypothetical protein
MNDGTVTFQAIGAYLEPIANLSEEVEIAIPASTPGDQESGLRLLEKLNLESIDPTAKTSPNIGSSVSEVSGGATTKTLGDAILARIDAVGANYKQNVTRAYAALEKSPRENTVEDLLKMQLDIAVVALEVEVVGKGVQKAVQHVDTLSKLQ